MSKFDQLKNQRWFAYTFAACVAVVLYLLLSQFPTFWNNFKIFIGYFNTLIVGAVIAYVLNPVCALTEKIFFRGIKKNKVRWALSVATTSVLMMLFIVAILFLLIPQLIDSVKNFLAGLSGYYESVQAWFMNLGVSLNELGYDIEKIIDSSESIVKFFVEYLTDNSGSLLSASTDIGASIFNFVISFILAIYFLLSKLNVLAGFKRLIKNLVSPKTYDRLMNVLIKSNSIVSRYMVFTIVDAIIVGVLNLLFMGLMGMDYIWLVSVVVAVTNIVPTFGPFIGGAIGAFIIFMVNPTDAVVFVGFTLILQLIDGYVLKPKLFGDSLGVSGLLILAAIIVFGKMFGVVGIILSIPIIAIFDYIYKSILLPSLEERHRLKYRTGKE